MNQKRLDDKSSKIANSNKTVVGKSSLGIPWEFIGNYLPISLSTLFRPEAKSQSTPHRRPCKPIDPWMLVILSFFLLPLQFHRVFRLSFPYGCRTRSEISQPIFWQRQRVQVRLYGFGGCTQQNRRNRIGAIE